MKICIVGLGKMGLQISKKLILAGHEIIGIDLDPKNSAIASEAGLNMAVDRRNALAMFYDQKAVIWLMIPAQFVNKEIKAWSMLLRQDDILIDGGNTDFRETKIHAEICHEKRVRFLDIGVSGGVLGEKNGFSMMVGGADEAYSEVAPLLDILAQPRGGHEHFGSAGSGHYVKMVHNAIEYGMMESIAEGYRLLREGPYVNLDLAKIGQIWQRSSVIESTLNGLVAESLREDSEMTKIEGYVAESGEAKWALEVAREQEIEMPAIESALRVRQSTADNQINYATKLLAVLRNKFGGHEVKRR